MALNKLTDRKAKAFHGPGLLGDGGGLFLQVTPSGSRSWIFRFKTAGKVRTMGLGACHAVTLAAAREKAAECRKQRADSLDPLEERRAAGAARKAQGVTFRQAAESCIETMQGGWRSAKTPSIWKYTLATYAYPHFGDLPVSLVTLARVEAALKPIWAKREEAGKPETARRLRRFIEAVLDYSTAKGWRSGDNPAKLDGPLRFLIPKLEEAATVTHHAAMPYAEVPAFVAELAARDDLSSIALHVLILTACRTSEVLNAKWDEVDLEKGVWTIPLRRMKTAKAHRVPLSTAAIAAFEAATRFRREGDDWVFPGARHGAPLSNMSLLQLLRRMRRQNVTAHGFRSSFRTWAEETTHYAHDVKEAALAHYSGSKVERAYQRSDHFAKRKPLMNDWSEFCVSTIEY